MLRGMPATSSNHCCNAHNIRLNGFNCLKSIKPPTQEHLSARTVSDSTPYGHYPGLKSYTRKVSAFSNLPPFLAGQAAMSGLRAEDKILVMLGLYARYHLQL